MHCVEAISKLLLFHFIQDTPEQLNSAWLAKDLFNSRFLFCENVFSPDMAFCLEDIVAS